MANTNKSFLTEAEKSVKTPKSPFFPKHARERHFEVAGDIRSALKYSTEIITQPESKQESAS